MARSKILAVDQDSVAYEPLQPGLSKYGYEMHTSTTVANALALASAHMYQAAFVSLTLSHDTQLLDGLHAENPYLPVILTLPPQHTHRIPQQMCRIVANTIGKPLTLEPVCLMLDRTVELAGLREQVRQQRLAWEPRQEMVVVESHDGLLRSPLSLSETLAHKLRHIVPDLQVLGGGSLYRVVLSYVEKLLIKTVLDECRGNQVKSAEVLGINRNTLRKKIRELDISFPRGNT